MPKQGIARLMGAAAAIALAPLSSVSAQTLTDLPVSQLRTEVGNRYEAALARSIDPAVVRADTNIYTWANEAKVQCGIALGYLKSGTKDEDSLRRCELAYGLMNQTPRQSSQSFTPPPPNIAADCPPDIAATFFFDWDSIVAPANAQQGVNFISQNRQRCGWNGFTVVGHTDRSGSDAYNNGLSLRRAQVIGAMMESAGIPSSIFDVSGRGETDPRVPTADNERTPENRRVEVRVK